MLNQDLFNKQGMEYFQKPATKQGKVKMKVIPWHCQQRYQSSISQISLNHTLTSAQNTRKIKTLLQNNKSLAKALEICKYELARKDNAENVDIISFAGIKLKDLSDNLKKMTVCVDETLALLQSHTSTKLAKNFLFAPGVRRTLKQKMQALSGSEKLQEVVETLENETDSASKQHFKNNKESKKSSAKNIRGKNVPTASSFKQKSIKKCLKPIIGKLPKNVSQRDSGPQDDSQPSYLLGLSSDLDSFKNKVEGKAEVASKAPRKKNPPKSKRDTENFTLTLHSTNAIRKSQQGTGSHKRGRLMQSSVDKKNEKDSCKAGKCTSHKKAKMTFTLQDGSTSSQSSSDGGMLSSGGKSCESIESLTSSFPETKEDKIASDLQYDYKISNLNEAFTAVCPNESNRATYNIHSAGMYRDLETECSLRQPRVVLRKTDLPENLKDKQSVPLNNVVDGCDGLSKKCALSEKGTETTLSAVTKKKVQFLLEEDDGIEILSLAPEPLKRLAIKKTQKRPLKENTLNLTSVPKKRALLTFGEALQKGDIMSKNTFIVTAEVHKPPDGFIPEKTQVVKSMNLLNMQPTVVLTDIYKCNSQKAVLGCTYQSRIVQKEPTTTEVIEKNSKSLCSEDTSNNHDLNVVSDKENKIDDQNFWEERKQSRRVSSKVSSYKEMKLNVKLRRC